MDLTRLNYFVAAAETGSFTEAARREYTSQPNISKQMLALEAELDVKLFHRENRTIRLTKAGEYLFKEIKDLPGKLNQIFETTRALSRGDQGQLTIGLLAGQMNADFIERFNAFHTAHPDVSFTLERASFAALRKALDSFQYDMIISLSFDIAPSPDLVVEPIKKQAGALFVSRMNPMSESIDLQALSQAPFIAISPQESFGGYQQLLRFGDQNGFEPNIVRLADSLDSLLFYVEAGIGVAVLDRNTRLETDRNIRVIPVPDSEAADVVAVWRRDNTNPNIRKMVDFLKD